jgi:lambda repressor-like predicted transcriptional regulator
VPLRANTSPQQPTGVGSVQKEPVDRKELLVAASEFQRTLMSNLTRQGMSVASLARQTGYSPLLLENLIAGKTRQIPVDFFVRIADTLGLTTAEKDALVRSWAFGIEKRSWRLTSV